MVYHIVAGEEMKKRMIGVIDNPIPFNEDLSVGTYIHDVFTLEFYQERCLVHHVSIDEYLSKLGLFINMLSSLKKEDDVHLYFGEDKTCLANRKILIEYLLPRVHSLVLHIMNEVECVEISCKILKKTH